MAPKNSFVYIILLTFLLSYILIVSSLSPPSPSSSSSTLYPKQLKALETLYIPNCIEISATALHPLSTLQDLSFINCSIQARKFPSDLTVNTTHISLSQLHNLTDLTSLKAGTNCNIWSIILDNIKKLERARMLKGNVIGFPSSAHHLNVSLINLAGCKLKGEIPNSLTHLSDLEFLNLNSNELSGTIPTSFGDLSSLRHMSLASNSLSGPIPKSISLIRSLVHLDLSSNNFNGTVPKFLSEMRNLRYLNLENNNFCGVLPFNESFIQMLEVFKVGGNRNMYYNHSQKLGMFPIPSDGEDFVMKQQCCPPAEQPPSPSPLKEISGIPRAIVLSVALGLSSLIFIIIFLVILSKCLS